MGMLTSPVPCRRLSGNGGFIVDVRAICHEVVHDINLPYTLQKKFSRNLLHFLHQGTGYPVFTDDFGWRIGCRIRQKVQDYPTSFVYLCCLPPSCALFRKRAVRHGSVQDDEGKCKKNAWFGQKKLQNPTPIHHPTPYPTSNPSSGIPCKYYRFCRRV